ncbi:phospholipid-binding lipoprotein MlaA [Pseudomonas psychrotolerans]|uniref:Phospholipid-binding lipoprotein MlaA n=2 Tax=Pseudomonas oryzihabitans TaxID=47885 RepID=A0AAJ2BHD1_9PSED|nr:phospholipid-binding lipoprotein MlaA [Pseudomonas psychrotolerans]MDR6679893.1 phospholipid-binding lipoprotein MlaA [Pseudomonas psychrotolerans]
MVRSLLALLLLASASAFAAEPNAASSSLTQSSTTMPPAPVGADGFTNPLSTLKYNPGLDQREFERASLEALDVYDPLEPWNRRVYHFNYRLDQWVLLPVVNGYRYITPGFVRSGVSNFFANLGDVTNLVNSLLQFKGRRALDTSGRLLINTTLGVFGLWDPATRMGLMRQPEDFGETLGFYGVGAGPYLMLPVLGPSNLRDTTGLAFDFTAESQINFLNVSQESGRHPEIILLRAVNLRYVNPFRYGQFDSPFEYEKLRYFYTKARELQIAE